MKRTFFKACSAISLMLSVALLALWIRSSRTADLLQWGDQRQRCMIRSSKGIVDFWRQSPLQLPPKENYFDYKTEDAVAVTYSDWVEMTLERNWFWHGFGLMTSHEDPGDDPTRHIGVALPHWFLIIASLLPAAAWYLARWRREHVRRTRVAAGLCLKCGYDLRASPDRCPECGTPVNATGH